MIIESDSATPSREWSELSGRRQGSCLRRRLVMRVGDIMTSGVKMAHTGMTVLEAAQLMSDTDVGGIPVVEDEEVVGFVTDRDIVLRVVAPGLDLRDTTVGDVMTKGAHKLTTDQDIQEAAQIMRENAIRRMVVTNDEGKIAGILSLGDLATRSGSVVNTGRVLGDIIAAQPSG
jgi:CBS domain-containing protein